MILVLLTSCRKDVAPVETTIWVTVKPVNYQVVVPGNSYREIVFDLTMSKDSSGVEYIDLPLPVKTTVRYQGKDYAMEIPPNEATYRASKNLRVTDTSAPTAAVIISVEYPDQSIKFKY